MRLETVLRRRYLLLSGFALLCFLTRTPVEGGDWHYFVSGSDLLVGRHPAGMDLPGGLHLYANYPELQIGPLGLAAAGFFRLVGFGHGHLVAQIAMCALAPLVVYLVEQAAVAVRGLHGALDDRLLALGALTGGALLVRSWTDAAGPVGHVDDVLALTACALSAWAVATRRPILTGVGIGLAIGAKPWGVLALPLVLGLSRETRLRAFAAMLATAGAAWLPFLVADPSSVSAAGRFTVWTRADSGLYALGIHGGSAPGWLRPTQIGLGLAFGIFAAARGRWAGALLAAFAVRIALDPAAWPYYTPELVLAALIWDLVGARRPLPVWTAVTFVGLVVGGSALASPGARGFERVAVAAAALAAAALVPRRGRLVEATS